VPESAASWVELRPSQRARAVLVLAQALSAAAALACLLALLRAPGPLRLAVAVAAVVALALVLRRDLDRTAVRLAVDADGAVRVRFSGAAEQTVATPRYTGPGFISLRVAGRSLAVWPDAMGASAWRRLLVACRWPARNEGAPAAVEAAAGDRTK
jgi:hypothetical protein